MTRHNLNDPDPSDHRHRNNLVRQLEKKTTRRMNARRAGRVNVLSGLSFFGFVGWSIVLLTLAGLVLGWWIDQRWPGPVSWTITFMFIGVVLGCMNAWRWIRQETQLRDKTGCNGQ